MVEGKRPVSAPFQPTLVLSMGDLPQCRTTNYSHRPTRPRPGRMTTNRPPRNFQWRNRLAQTRRIPARCRQRFARAAAAAEKRADEAAAAKQREAEAAAEAEAEAAAAKEAQESEDDAERLYRVLVVTSLEESILEDAKDRVKEGTLTGPILEASCTPVAGGSTDDLTALTGSYDCIAVNEENDDGSASGYRFSATTNWDDGSYSWQLGG